MKQMITYKDQLLIEINSLPEDYLPYLLAMVRLFRQSILLDKRRRKSRSFSARELERRRELGAQLIASLKKGLSGITQSDLDELRKDDTNRF
jgi:hypothetical protein